MLFNSIDFMFFFLPIVFLVYFLLNRLDTNIFGKIWLVCSSLFFYSYWNSSYLFLILISLSLNYAAGVLLSRGYSNKISKKGRKIVLSVGVLFNISLLGYYKYSTFILENVSSLLGQSATLEQIVLPLAISFFTFQQIAYLVDAYKLKCDEYDFLTYCLFVTFFPQLIAGPIVHHTEMMPQFSTKGQESFVTGIYL